MAMDIHVYDTYVKAKDGHTMHFDVITGAQDHDKAIEYAKQWLVTVGEDGAKVTGEECQFCHTQGAPENVENEIKEKGFFIQKMDGCP
jgi:cytochrome c5